MALRISDDFSQTTFLRNLRRAQDASSAALARLASGKRVRSASDDPRAAARIGRIAEELQRLETRRGVLAQARPWLELTEQAMTELGGILERARTLAIQGASDHLQQGQRDAIAEQIAGLIDRTNGLADLRVGGRFIFSGTLTDRTPFDAAGAYQGNDAEIAIPLDDGSLTINMPGDVVFGESGAGGARDLLEQLEAALRSSDTAGVQALLDPLEQAIADNASRLSQIGARRERLEEADARLGDRILGAKTSMSDLRDADIARAISDSQKFGVATQAALAAGARLFGPTFFDFLG